jgi:hypothetical protein
MRGKWLLSAAVLAAAALGVQAAPPDVPKEVPANPGQLVRVTVKGADVGFQPAFGEAEAFFDELAPRDGSRRFVFQATKPGVYVVSFVTVGEGEIVCCTITVGGAPPKPPVPPDPPTPPDPPDPPTPPDALKSFRVILVYESADKLRATDPGGVIFGGPVERWLDANCTGGRAGWRRRDKDTAAETDTAMLGLWNAVKPGAGDPNRITKVPCMVLERNNKVEIVNLPGTQTEALALLRKYLEGK